MIRLFIKGNAEEARAALDARKLGTVTALDDVTFRTWAHVVADVHDGDLETVVAWFCETAAPPPGGYRPGTLLFYTHRWEHT